MKRKTVKRKNNQKRMQNDRKEEMKDTLETHANEKEKFVQT